MKATVDKTITAKVELITRRRRTTSMFAIAQPLIHVGKEPSMTMTMKDESKIKVKGSELIAKE